jgi:hypothetical protein
VLAAYVADEALLGRPERGWAAIDRALARGELSPRGTGYPVGRAYVGKLRVFLHKAGYLR